MEQLLMDTINFTPFPALATERLVLRQLVPADAEDILRLRADASVSKYIARQPYTTIDEANGFIAKINTSIANNEAGYWAIALKTDNKLIGTSCIWNIQHENYRAEIGYELLPDFQGKGIMQEALGVLLNYGFNTLKLHSIEAVVYPKNVASIKLLEKYNFVREAYFKENFYFNSQFLDTAIYTLLSRNFNK
jgi:ribosomal-protein-alanine N-acetyltransferase